MSLYDGSNKLNDTIKLFDGKESDNPLTTRTAILTILASQPPNGEKAFITYSLGMKISGLTDDLNSLSTEERGHLLSCVKESKIYFALVQGFLISVLQ